jgi:hypothetical protein
MGKRSGVFMVLGALSLGMVAMTPTVSSASPANFGFESDLASWTMTKTGSASASVVSSSTIGSATYTAPYGKNFLLLTESILGETATVTQTFSMNSGESLVGKMLFLPSNPPSGFSAKILIGQNNNSYEILVADTNGWKDWSWQAKAAGQYSLTYQITGYSTGQNYAMFDAVPVPVSGALLLLGSGMMGLVGIGVRKNRPALF